MDNRGLLSDSIGVANVYRVIVTVPCDKDCGGRVVPSNVYSSDFGPVGGDLDGFFGDFVVGNGKNSSTTQDWYASDPSFSFMRRIRCNNGGSCFLRDMGRMFQSPCA